METAESIVFKLNEMLDADKFSPEAFIELMVAFKELCNPEIKILDFEYYNEKLLKKLKKEKIRLVSIQDFEAAARLRGEEKECLGHISIRKEYNNRKSMFFYDKNCLVYFCIGTAPNDKLIKKHLTL